KTMTLSFFITVIPDHDKPQPPGCLLETEFTPLVARIQLMQKDLRHGLKMSIERGSSRLILPPQHCKNAKEGADVTTTLYVPFLNREFIPSIRSEWMANHY
ncbi:hypothetical protein POY26_26590, partial [Escherichia coli]